MCEIFRNYNELLEADEAISKELVEERGEGTWQENEIYFHSDLESFAEYELMEGWYIDTINLDRDFRGAPNPMNFIDFEALGNALTNSWDNSCYYKTEKGNVLSTSYGW